MNALTNDIRTLHHEAILRWSASPVAIQSQDFLKLVEENHAFNVQLWNTEDKARRDDMGYEYVYRAKRAIDGFNQQRNNRMEAMDEWLFHALKPAAPDACPVHSETPGMMIDRLSILALKVHHMGLQLAREDVDDAHKAQCQAKHATLLAQQAQLYACLDVLLDEISKHTRTFRVYHQFKMYNDPTLNPELYRSSKD